MVVSANGEHLPSDARASISGPEKSVQASE